MSGPPFNLQPSEVWRLLRVRFLLIGAIATAIGLLFMKTASAAETKRVLIVNSFGTTAPPFSFQSTAFKSALVAKMGEPVDLDEVSLDMARYDIDMQQAVVDYLEKRQAKWRTDLVVAIGAPAATFVAGHRDQLFRETPILYAAADRRLLPPDALERNAAYVGQLLDIAGLFEDILQVAPSTKNIEIVVGATPLERLWQEAFKKASEPLAGRIKFTYYSDLSFDQMLQRGATLPPDSYILFLLLLRDTQGVTINADEAMQRLHQVARAPINSLFAHQLGTGIVGGRLLQSDRLGKVAADVAVGILHGKPASSFPPTVIERLSPHYDWRELRRWKIDEKLLPPGSTVLYRTPSLWEEHRALIIGGISICVVEGLLIAGLVVNLMRRRRAERSLSESEDRVALAADAAHLGVWELDVATNNVWLSDKMRDLFQIPPGTAVDYAALQERVHPDDRPLRDSAIKRAIETKGIYEIEYRVLRPDGVVRWISGRARCLSDGRRRSTRLLGVAMDVTKRKQAELKAQRLQDEIAHVGRVSMMGQLASALAHEINQPLGAILRNAEAAELFMQNKTPDLEEIRAILADIRTDDQRAGSVIDRMRALLRRHVLDTQLLDLAELVGSVTQLAGPDAAMRHVEFQVNLPVDLPPVRGDRVHLQQVLLNLILNGMDAMNEASQENRRVTVRARVDDARTVEIEVSDTGQGIAAEKLAQIFDPFFTTKPNGMGMGLAISRTIVESHGGRLWAENNSDIGATFRFTLVAGEAKAP
jgi:PAS domain S-box-containing protein